MPSRRCSPRRLVRVRQFPYLDPRRRRFPDPPAPLGTIQTTIPAPGGPAVALVEDGSVWIADHRSPTLFRLDPQTGGISATVSLDPTGRFDHTALLVAGVGGPWALPFAIDTHESALVHIDAATNGLLTSPQLQRALQTLGLNGADMVADTASGLWAAASDIDGTIVAELDRSDGHILRTARVAGPAPVHVLLPAFGSLWLGGWGNPIVDRLDPTTGRLTAAVTLPSWPVSLAAGAEALYVAQADGSVARVDPARECVTAVAFLGGAATDPTVGGQDAISIAVGSAAFYVGYDRGAIATLDLRTLAVRRAVRVDSQDFQGGLAASDGSVWYPTFGNDTILRIKR